MLKLIDVFQLSKDIEEYFLSKIDKNEYEVDAVDCHADIQAILRKQPEAYDIDKTIKQLEDYRNMYSGTNHDKYEAVSLAIEIVKGGANE